MEKSSKPITLQAIADRAGVTRALVSMALRNSPKVAKTTRDRIQKIARELNYQINPMLRALMTSVRQRRTVQYRGTLAFVTNFSTATYWKKLHTYPNYFTGANERAQELGYQLEHFWIGEYQKDPNRLINVLKARGIPGILLPPLPQCNREFNLDLSQFSAITLGYSIKCPSLPRVCGHHTQTIAEAIERLNTMGYRRIGVVLHENEIVQVNYLWLAGIAIAQYKLPHVTIRVFKPKEWTYSAFKSWYKKEQPEVIVGVYPETWEWIQKLGKKIPDELGIFHLDCREDDYYSGMVSPKGDAGGAAIEMLIGFIEGNIRYNEEEPRILMLNATFHPGSTVRDLTS